MADVSLPMQGGLLTKERTEVASIALVLTASLLAAAGVIHLVMVPGHMGEWVAEGIGFAVAGWLQIGLCVAVATRPSRRWLVGVVALNAVLTVLWIISRTNGFPVGPHANHAESIGLVDGATVAMQVVAALVAIGLLASSSGVAAGRLQGMGTLVPLAVVALTTGVLVSPSARTHAHDAHGGHGAAATAEAGHTHTDDATGSALASEDAAHTHTDDAAALAATDGSAEGTATHSHGTEPAPDPALASAATAGDATVTTVAGDGHSHSHGTEPAAAADGTVVDDKGFSLLMNGHQHAHEDEPMDGPTTALLAHQLARTSELVAMYPDVASAEAAGYHRQGPFGPGLGTHYGKGGGTLVGGTIDEESILKPMLIFDGSEPTSKLIGFMYIAFGVQGIPEGFAGPNDIWHNHTNVCITMNADGSTNAPFGSDRDNITKDLCDSVGGFLIEDTGYMLHVWTVPGYENPLGVFHETHPGITCADGTYHTKDPEKLGNSVSFCADAP